MKYIINQLLVISLIVMLLPQLGTSQDNVENDFRYEINRNHPYLSITKDQLQNAVTLIDLNYRYKESWVKSYQSVEILTSHNGKIISTLSKNDTLTQEQKDNMQLADSGKDIAVNIHYLPENNLKDNIIREENFKFHVSPESEAIYPEGNEVLQSYLKENVIDKIPDQTFTGYKLAAVKFTVTEEGQIINPKVFWTSENENLDALMLQTISNMPCWQPAEYANGTKVAQEFVFTVGNHKSCVTNLLNVQSDNWGILETEE